MLGRKKNREFLTEDGMDKENTNDFEMDKDFEEGGKAVSPSVYKEDQDSCQEIQDRGEADPKNGEASCQEAQGNEGQESPSQPTPEADSEELLEECEAPAAYEATFTPDNGGYNTVVVEKEKPKKKKKGYGGRILTVILSAILAILLGSMAGILTAYYTHLWLDDADVNGANSQGPESVTVTKNDGSIIVNEVIGSTGHSNLTVSQVVSLVADSVVEVFNQQGEEDDLETVGAGRGVIYAQSATYGYFVTNQHVIQGADTVKIRLTNGSVYTAEYMHGEEQLDIAVMRFATTEKLTVAICGSSSSGSLHVGDSVVAIGNPMGNLGGTVTNGIISALNREIKLDGISMELLQTNAAVNPGNSGGGLFNMAGELIGIVNAKKASTGIEGLGFAIPIDSIYDIMVEILREGYLHGKVTFGIQVSTLTLDEAQAIGGRQAGVYVISSQTGSFIYGDCIEKINDKPITNLGDYYAAINEIEIGDRVVFLAVRKNGTTYRRGTITVTAQEYVPGMFD